VQAGYIETGLPVTSLRVVIVKPSKYDEMSRMASARGLHPMAGGIGRVRRDRAGDYSELPRRTFGIDQAPLPLSLPLSKTEEEINRRAKLVPA